MERIIIEAAVSGPAKSRNSKAPVTAAETTRDILACIDAGAAVVHNHLESFNITGPAAAEGYGAIWRPVLARHPEAILIPTLAAPHPDDELGAYAHIPGAMANGASLGPIDPGSVNLSGALPDGQPDPARSAAFVNDYATLDRALERYARHGVPSSISIWDPTFLRAAMAYERAGRFAPGSFLKLFFGGDHSYLDGRPGVSFGLPPTVEALDLYLRMMEGSRLPWAAAVLGGDLVAEPGFVEAVVARGGHLRVGLEDYAGDRTPANGDIVAAAVARLAGLGRAPATQAEARAM
ncbi:MAG TPA: 3-keto-5-aminohexanoate cleavage protein, partial [Phenylobacterium sp.]|uniref:3-keto-5-aminohexanoate cleavage protein n=1 Tax=Phenylobacterium sp. TaxID=1871053 RepID=UPI002B482D9E